MSSVGAGDRVTSASVQRGLTACESTTVLKERIQLRSLRILARFRVMRTIDVAVACFPERPFKAALTAAQRAVRGMVKADLIRRYRTDRFQTIYGLTARGAAWLEERDIDAASSLRRVSDMTNPEHRLWSQFLVLASEARGRRAQTEGELLTELNSRREERTGALVQGLLSVTICRGSTRVTRSLRPDAVASEEDGLTWFEVDRSKRGADREAALAALVASIGSPLQNGQHLRRVVVHCKTARIEMRARAVLRAMTAAQEGQVLIDNRVQLKEMEAGVYEVWRAREKRLSDGRLQLVDHLAGHVIVQMLPSWLPKVRIDSTNRHSTAGWFEENFLPYRRPASVPGWPAVVTPLSSTESGRASMQVGAQSV